MAILNILSNAASIVRGHSLSVVQTKSDGGIRKAQKRGPLLYNFEVEVISMYDNSDEYYGIENEVMNTFGYGVNTATTQLPSVEIKNRGSWAGTPRSKGTSQTGNSINLDGFTINVTNIVKAGDWVQFPGSTKVFQVTADASSDSGGNVTILLNTPLVGTLVDNQLITVGNSVEFKLALVNPDSVDPVKTPVSDLFSLAEWGSFQLEEVL